MPRGHEDLVLSRQSRVTDVANEIDVYMLRLVR